MFSSTEPIISRQMDKLNSFLFSPSASFKNCEQAIHNEAKEIMGSEYFQQIQQSSNNNNNNNNGGLTRYRSAPSSFFAGLLDGDIANNSGENYVTHDGSSSSDSDTMFTALLNGNNNSSNDNMNDQISIQKNQQLFGSCMKQETSENNGFESGLNYGVGVQMQSSRSVGLSSTNGNGGGSNLIRQSSSPAGFFNGFDVMGEVGNYRTGANREASASANGFNSHISYSSAQNSSSNLMPSIAENESWNDSSFNSLKRSRDGDLKVFSNNFNAINTQNGESRNYTSGSGLTHHLSLPKTSSEMAAIEKYLQFQQDSVPCKIRAKRGFATHPRSIAERVRRTRISERMKKLQDLFPNMDKQANTADMLDLAVDYIKDLQKQVQTLNDKKAKCSCPSKQLQYSNGTT